MSVNGVDYTKTMAKEREYFRDTARKLQASTKQQLRNEEEVKDRKLSQQRENFIRDKEKINNDRINNLNEVKEKAITEQRKLKDRYANDVSQEREKFAKELVENKKDFDNRLNSIRSSYGKSVADEKENQNNISEINQKKFHKNVNDLKETHQKNFDNFVQNVTRKDSDNQTRNVAARNKAEEANREKMIKFQNDSRLAMERKKEINSIENSRMMDKHAAEMNEQKIYTRDRLDNMKNKFQAKTESLAEDYQSRSDRKMTEQKRLDDKNNFNQIDKMSKIRGDHQHELRQLELDRKRQNETTAGSFLEFKKRQEGIKDQESYNQRIREIKDRFFDEQQKFIAEANSHQDNFNHELRHQNREASNYTLRKLDEAKADKLQSMERQKRISDRDYNYLENQKNLDKIAYDSGLSSKENNSKIQVNRLKENFYTTVKILEDKHLADIQDLSRTSNKDKNEFIRSMQKRRSQEIYDMKRAFNNVMDATIRDYEYRLTDSYRENAQLKQYMNEKIQKVMDQTQKELEVQKNLFEDRLTADLRSQKMIMDEREHILRKNMDEMRTIYEKKLDKIQFESESEIKLITNDYNNKFSDLKEFTRKELEKKEVNSKLEISRLKETSEKELSRVTNMYEAQIDSLRNVHKEQMNNVIKNNKIS